MAFVHTIRMRRNVTVARRLGFTQRNIGCAGAELNRVYFETCGLRGCRGGGGFPYAEDRFERFDPTPCYELTTTVGARRRRVCVRWPSMPPMPAAANASWRCMISLKAPAPRRWRRAPAAIRKP